MKNTIFTFIFGTLLLAVSTARANSIFCAPDAHDAQTELRWDGAKVNLRVVIPMGYDHLPQLEDPFFISLIPFLKMQSEDLESLGSDFSLSWDASKCEIPANDPWLVHCGIGGKVLQNTAVQNDGMEGLIESQRSRYGTQERWKLRLILERNNIYFVSIPFPKSFCKVSKD